MIEHGIGLLLWQNANEADKRVECIVDVFGAGKNTYSEGKKDKSIREMVFETISHTKGIGPSRLITQTTNTNHESTIQTNLGMDQKPIP
jgi:hypothetical protein